MDELIRGPGISSMCKKKRAQTSKHLKSFIETMSSSKQSPTSSDNDDHYETDHGETDYSGGIDPRSIHYKNETIKGAQAESVPPKDGEEVSLVRIIERQHATDIKLDKIIEILSEVKEGNARLSRAENDARLTASMKNAAASMIDVGQNNGVTTPTSDN
ncbi:uncharacterized protein J8A68_005272 [[Candida] subhashii]|uniref:Uncharacterized protein n=1 Tax=[Candida] subhashii TaxID=561895 RepID=A0A8J5Q3N1_9ASCO|nr:uncharacterized protein J8A68_005272 [[Candida] subhashii]KAG7661214.1 hypothetical protein J8A68_005272 [[Candida] subhashii]